MKVLVDRAKSMKKHVIAVFSLAMVTSLFAAPAFAFTQPTANSIMYSVYNLLIVGMINNGVSYIVGFLAILTGAFFLMQQKLVVTLFCFIGGILFLSAGQIATAFGYCF